MEAPLAELEGSAVLVKAVKEEPATRSLGYQPHFVSHGDAKPTWKPWILRFPALALVVSLTLALIGLLEYAAVVLPATDSTLFHTRPHAPSIQRRRGNALLERRPQGSFLSSGVSFATSDTSGVLGTNGLPLPTASGRNESNARGNDHVPAVAVTLLTDTVYLTTSATVTSPSSADTSTTPTSTVVTSTPTSTTPTSTTATSTTPTSTPTPVATVYVSSQQSYYPIVSSGFDTQYLQSGTPSIFTPPTAPSNPPDTRPAHKSLYTPTLEQTSPTAAVGIGPSAQPSQGTPAPPISYVETSAFGTGYVHPSVTLYTPVPPGQDWQCTPKPPGYVYTTPLPATFCFVSAAYISEYVHSSVTRYTPVPPGHTAPGTPTPPISYVESSAVGTGYVHPSVTLYTPLPPGQNAQGTPTPPISYVESSAVGTGYVHPTVTLYTPVPPGHTVHSTPIPPISYVESSAFGTGYVHPTVTLYTPVPHGHTAQGTPTHAAPGHVTDVEKSLPHPSAAQSEYVGSQGAVDFTPTIDGHVAVQHTIYTPESQLSSFQGFAVSVDGYVAVQHTIYTPGSHAAASLQDQWAPSSKAASVIPLQEYSMSISGEEGLAIPTAQTIAAVTVLSDFVHTDDKLTTTTPSTRPTSTSSHTKSRLLITQTPKSTHTSSMQYVTETMNYVAINNNRNPNFNPSLLPNATVMDGDKLVVYAISVHYPWWASAAGAILPVLIITLYRVVWTMLSNSVKLMEPFALLSRPGGATAEESFFSYYLATNTSTRPLAGLRHGHWVLVLAGIISILSGLLSPFASEVLTTSTHDCPWTATANSTNLNPCPPQLMVDLDAIRVLQGLLGVVALLAIVLGLALYRRNQTGVYADPSSIAAIASLTHHPDFIEDFERAEAGVTGKGLKQSLEGRRYQLRQYQTSTGGYRYGFVPMAHLPRVDVDEDEFGPITSSRSGHYQNVGRSSGGSSKSGFILMDVLFGLLITGLLIVIVAYYLDADMQDPFNDFLNSDGFGPRFILTAAGAVIASQWRSVHADVSVKNIYAELAAGNARAIGTLCAERPTTAMTSLVPSLMHRHFMTAFIAFVTTLADALIISLPGIPFTSGEYHLQFIICTFFSIAVLSLMLLTLLEVSLWRFFRVPHLPLRPDVLAGVVSYVASSSLLRDTEELEFLTGDERDLTLDGMGKRWKYGLVEAADERNHRWMIEEDLTG